ncbi:hypothetical protein [Nostoc sp. C117]|uniref:hypothetical protein n=1 Tax=Nostoc sp. C117 TaxID=3349875 RepID=UPI00370D2B38
MGDDAQALASLGFEVTAFDISPTAMSDDKLLLLETLRERICVWRQYIQTPNPDIV